MPPRPKRPCAHIGCPELVTPPERYCAAHKQDAAAYDRQRGTARERGYSSHWERVRLAYLRQHPLCEECEAQGVVRPAEDVHHKDGDTRHNEASNLQALCRECHNRITVRQRG